jgi:hypothetical protein
MISTFVFVLLVALGSSANQTEQVDGWWTTSLSSPAVLEEIRANASYARRLDVVDRARQGESALLKMRSAVTGLYGVKEVDMIQDVMWYSSLQDQRLVDAMVAALRSDQGKFVVSVGGMSDTAG